MLDIFLKPIIFNIELVPSAIKVFLFTSLTNVGLLKVDLLPY